jgi:solute carrier family 35 protein E1
MGGLPRIQLGLPSSKTTAFVISCLLWYLSSALSSNTSKALLSSPKNISPRPPPPFPYPVTLTLAQFVFVHLLSAAITSPTIMRHVPGVRKPVTKLAKNPGWDRILDMAKLSIFNVVGHALSTIAISRVPVSTVHTIKVSKTRETDFILPLTSLDL